LGSLLTLSAGIEIAFSLIFTTLGAGGMIALPGAMASAATEECGFTGRASMTNLGAGGDFSRPAGFSSIASL
jgi:hypothetical protein